VLVLMIFTDAGLAPQPASPPGQGSAQEGQGSQAGDPRDRHVDGVMLYRAPARRDAGADAAAPPR